MLTNREVSRCEARLGPVALFMPTKPEGDYKLDLRAFADRQIVTLLLGEYRSCAGLHETDATPPPPVSISAGRLLKINGAHPPMRKRSALTRSGRFCDTHGTAVVEHPSFEKL